MNNAAEPALNLLRNRTGLNLANKPRQAFEALSGDGKLKLVVETSKSHITLLLADMPSFIGVPEKEILVTVPLRGETPMYANLLRENGQKIGGKHPVDPHAALARIQQAGLAPRLVA